MEVTNLWAHQAQLPGRRRRIGRAAPGWLGRAFLSSPLIDETSDTVGSLALAHRCTAPSCGATYVDSHLSSGT